MSFYKKIIKNLTISQKYEKDVTITGKTMKKQHRKHNMNSIKNLYYTIGEQWNQYNKVQKTILLSIIASGGLIGGIAGEHYNNKQANTQEKPTLTVTAIPPETVTETVEKYIEQYGNHYDPHNNPTHVNNSYSEPIEQSDVSTTSTEQEETEDNIHKPINDTENVEPTTTMTTIIDIPTTINDVIETTVTQTDIPVEPIPTVNPIINEPQNNPVNTPTDSPVSE